MSLQVVEKGIYQVMSDGTKTFVPFGITKRERRREMKREMKRILRSVEVARDMLRTCFKQIAAETGLPTQSWEMIIETNGRNSDGHFPVQDVS